MQSLQQELAEVCKASAAGHHLEPRPILPAAQGGEPTAEGEPAPEQRKQWRRASGRRTQQRPNSSGQRSQGLAGHTFGHAFA